MTTRMLLKTFVSLLAVLVAAEATLVRAVRATAAIRRRGRWQPPEGFPWQDRPEVELESGDGRLKLYPEYEGLYEAMIEEIEGAREGSFIETFLVKADEFFGLHESNLEAHSERLAAQMEQTFELDKTNARELTLEDWHERPAYDKALRWGVAPLAHTGLISPGCTTDAP